MRSNARKIIIFVALALLGVFHAPADSFAKTYVFTGGKAGGTAIYYANAVSTLAKKEGLKLLVNSSGGAVEQIRLVNSGSSSFSLAYAGQLWAAERGKLTGDPKKYTNVRAVSTLYGAPAQLIVKADSDIKMAKNLVGKRVGVGNAGSGAAVNSELFFKQLGIWDKIDRNFLGYRQAADAFKNRQLDAFWVFVSAPNSSVIEAAMQNKIRILSIYKEAEECGLIKKYPYFSKVVIPANTYKGVDKDTVTFQDQTIWIVNKDVPNDVVYKIAKIVFSKKGLTHMVNAHKSAKALSMKTSGKNTVIKLHPGAAKFWREKGVIK